MVRHHYRVGLPDEGEWVEALTSDAAVYGGGNVGNNGSVWTDRHPWQGQPFSAHMTLPPLAILVLKRKAGQPVAEPSAPETPEEQAKEPEKPEEKE